jgi:predicted AAA+ superfamily ATPase
VAPSNRDRVGRGFELLAEGLLPFVDRRMSAVVPAGADWLELLARRDQRDGRTVPYQRNDPQTLLRVLTEERRSFKDALAPSELAYASELRGVRNDWAHNSPFSDSDTQRALDTMERLLQAAGAVPQAETVRELLHDHRRAEFERLTRRRARQAAAVDVEGLGLKPWREVIRPHQDVATAKFSLAEFAADLSLVSREEEQEKFRDYVDPIVFFGRTYLTEGLSDLLRRAVRRVSGDLNAAPVVNLQTNFGGGKTHSILALYHLFCGRPLTQFPQDVQELVGGLDVDFDRIGEVRRVTLVGNHLSPSLGMPKPGGIHVNTLWGELAWRLGGADAYRSIAEADRTATNPGGALRELIAAYAPCLILIDEWVAYARQLFGTDGSLPAGDFDTQFTFAQTLTEAVKTIPGALLVVSIPASHRDGDAASLMEVGGPNGERALRALQNVVRRVAHQWRPASAQESFEIVRRRLFEEPSGEARADIAVVARRFSQFYGEHRGEFPSWCAEPDYEARIRAAYPIHPELFDRLYEDWSTLERFHRTRGVLRLMSAVIFALWNSPDRSPLIMPGTLPLEDSFASSELTQYLEDNWKSIIDTDVAGPGSTPARVDLERSTFGQRQVTRRLARTVFFGSAATLKSAHKGIDQQRVWLGTAIPGDTVGNFGSALHVLQDQATYLYSDASRYWYDTQASVARTAKDYAERLKERPEEVWAEIASRLERQVKRPRGDFASVVAAPEGNGDIPDHDEARLVLLHPRFAHKRNGDDSAAMRFVAQALDNRGSSRRDYRNMLVFLAPDERRLEELMEAARDYLAWQSVCERANELDLSPKQQRQAEQRRQRANEATDQRIGTTYVWVLAPEQRDPKRPVTWQTLKAEGSSADLAERVSTKLRSEGALGAMHVSRNIHNYLIGPLGPVWQRGHVSVGELWRYYTHHPYLPRLRDQSVLEAGIHDVLTSITWEQDGFALATGYDESTGRYEGLAIPNTDTFGLITNDTLLVRPDLAVRQREADLSDHPSSGGEDTGQGQTIPRGRDTTTAGGVPPGPPPPPAKSRFFGVFRVSPDRYGRDLSRIAQEILQHLDQPAGELHVTVEIEASNPAGFPETTIRTVSENARAMKFEQADFEDPGV